MKLSLLLAAVTVCLLAAGPAQAQITIERGDLPQQYGDSMRHKYNVGTASVNVLEPGGPQSWVFDTTAFTGALRWYVIEDPAQTPFAAEFPDANYVDHTLPDAYPDNSAYNYMRLEDDALHLLGTGTVTSDTSYARILDAWHKMLALPLVFGGAWDGTSSWHVPINDSMEVFCERWSHMSVDGWGTVEIPMGTFNCLRVDCYDTLINTNYRNGEPVYSDTHGFRGYTWWTGEHGMAASASGPTDDTSHVFTESDCYWVLVGRTAGAIAERPSLPAQSERLLPGVIAGSAVVRGRETERFTVLDVTGRSVTVQPGSRLGAGLPAGVYLVRGHTGEQPQRVVKVR